MTVTIRFNENIKDETIYSYTHKWISDFNIPTEEGRNIGGFHGLKDSINNQFEQFSVTNTSGDKATIILSGEINFNLCHRTIYGKVDSLEFGKGGVIKNEENNIIIEKHLVYPQLIFNDLNIVGEYDDFKMTAENRGNDTHQIGFNLNKDNAGVLLAILETQGVDVNAPLKDIAVASQFNIPTIYAIGTNDSSDILLAA